MPTDLTKYIKNELEEIPIGKIRTLTVKAKNEKLLGE
jgi:hypothetical protein